MSWKLVNEILIPAEHGRAWRVNAGQTMRIINTEGPQVGDLAVFNAHDYTEIYDPDASYVRNWRQGTGNGHRIQYLYARPPKMSLMLEVTDDKVGRHWIVSGSRCNLLTYKLRGQIPENGYHRSCQDNIAEAIHEFGLPPERVPDVFNLWMTVDHNPEDMSYVVKEALCQKGDYIDFLAHMDCLIALSACPATEKGVSAINGDVNKSLKAEIWEQSG